MADSNFRLKNIGWDRNGDIILYWDFGWHFLNFNICTFNLVFFIGKSKRIIASNSGKIIFTGNLNYEDCLLRLW